jgi:DNA-binding protein Fis
VEKSDVALLCYVTAQDIPITETAVLEELGTAKSRAYAIREKVMEALRQEMRNIEGGDSPLFGRVLLEAVEAGLTERVRSKLTGGAS